MSAPDQKALGLVETRGLVAALEAADAMLKAAEVRLVRIEKTVPALMTVQVVGETAAVRSAVDAGRAAAERVGTVVSVHVISRPADEMAALQRLGGTAPPDKLSRKASTGSLSRKASTESPSRKASTESPVPTAPAESPSRKASRAEPARKKTTGTDLDAMTVRELRALARETEGLSIQGRAIARASKSELLAAFRERSG